MHCWRSKEKKKREGKYSCHIGRACLLVAALRLLRECLIGPWCSVLTGRGGPCDVSCSHLKERYIGTPNNYIRDSTVCRWPGYTYSRTRQAIMGHQCVAMQGKEEDEKLNRFQTSIDVFFSTIHPIKKTIWTIYSLELSKKWDPIWYFYFYVTIQYFSILVQQFNIWS